MADENDEVRLVSNISTTISIQAVFNTVKKNKGDGISVRGTSNFSKVEKNISVANNRRAGIRIIRSRCRA